MVTFQQEEGWHQKQGTTIVKAEESYPPLIAKAFQGGDLRHFHKSLLQHHSMAKEFDFRR
jgi:hypothetical protein